MSNAQRRRAQRDRGQHPGPMTPQRVSDHRLMQTRLADLERLRRMAVTFMSEHSADAGREEAQVTTEDQQVDMEAVAGFVDELRDFLTDPAEPGDLPDLLEDDESPEVHRCPCGFPDAADGSMEHVLTHNRDEVCGAVSVEWTGGDPHGVGYPAPQLFVIKDVHTGVQLYPARITIMADAAATLAIADVTELINADGQPIRSDTRGKMGVFTEEYKEWNAADHAEGDVYMGDKYVARVSRFVLANGPRVVGA